MYLINWRHQLIEIWADGLHSTHATKVKTLREESGAAALGQCLNLKKVTDLQEDPKSIKTFQKTWQTLKAGCLNPGYVLLITLDSLWLKFPY